jgi:predicted RNA methylase
MLSIACSLMGCANVIGVDVDSDALDTCWVNIHKLDIQNVDIIQSDIQTIKFSSRFDTVVSNPPFGIIQ